MIETFYELVFGGIAAALFAQALRSLIQISYQSSDSKWKLETYVTLGKIRLLGFATSSIGGALTALYLLKEINGG